MKTSNRALQTLEGLCVEAIFSSLFQPQFRAHKPGRKIAEAASGHCHNSHTWPFGQEEVQLREFVSTLHVKPLSGPGNLAADEPHEHSESCTTPPPNSKVALASTARFAPSCMPRNRLHVMSQHCLKGEGGLMMTPLEGLCFTASYLGLLSAPPCLSQLPQRSTVSQDMALSRALGPGDVHPALMFFHLSPSKSSWVPPGHRVPSGSHRVPPGSHRVPPGSTRVPFFSDRVPYPV